PLPVGAPGVIRPLPVAVKVLVSVVPVMAPIALVAVAVTGPQRSAGVVVAVAVPLVGGVSRLPPVDDAVLVGQDVGGHRHAAAHLARLAGSALGGEGDRGSSGNGHVRCPFR